MIYVWYIGDRASLLVTNDYRPVVSVLMKLCGGSSKNEYSKDMNIDAFLEQMEQLNQETKTLTGISYMFIFIKIFFYIKIFYIV